MLAALLCGGVPPRRSRGGVGVGGRGIVRVAWLGMGVCSDNVPEAAPRGMGVCPTAFRVTHSYLTPRLNGLLESVQL